MSSAPLLNPSLHSYLSAHRRPPPHLQGGDRRRPLPMWRTAAGTVPNFTARCSRTAFRCCAGDLAGGGETNPPADASGAQGHQENKGFWSTWKPFGGMGTAEMSARIAKLGLAAVLAYGLFDGVTYTTFFVLAFLGYERSTGKNPAANLKALLGIVILMWTGNNITRPFRVAGAAALAPVFDEGLKRIQKYFNFPSLIYAFALIVGIVAGSCLAVVGLLIFTRWGK